MTDLHTPPPTPQPDYETLRNRPNGFGFTVAAYGTPNDSGARPPPLRAHAQSIESNRSRGSNGAASNHSRGSNGSNGAANGPTNGGNNATQYRPEGFLNGIMGLYNEKMTNDPDYKSLNVKLVKPETLRRSTVSNTATPVGILDTEANIQRVMKGKLDFNDFKVGL